MCKDYSLFSQIFTEEAMGIDRKGGKKNDDKLPFLYWGKNVDARKNHTSKHKNSKLISAVKN